METVDLGMRPISPVSQCSGSVSGSKVIVFDGKRQVEIVFLGR